MIRWSYVLPRLIGVGLVLGFLTFGLPPLVRWLTVASLQAMIGAKVDLDRVDVGLFPPRLVYHGMSLANPSGDKSFRDLVSTEAIALHIDGAALLRRRYVVREARISGLQFDTERLESGHLDPPADEPSEPSWVASWLSGHLRSAGEMGKSQLQGWADESHLRRRSDQIRRRWKSEYERLARRAEDLEVGMREVHETAKGIENPLRDLARIDAALTQARGIQQELVAVREKLAGLPNDVQADLDSLEEAKQADLRRARELIPFDLAAVDELGPALVRDTLRNQMDRLRGYLQTGREVSRWTVAEPKIERQRGEWIDLTAGRQQPKLLIARCELSGLVRSGGQTHAFSGVVKNLTSQPELRGEPLRARFRMEGPQVALVEYVRDDSVAPAAETWRLHWPDTKAPTVRLGSKDTLDLNVHEGRIEWWVEVRARGERLDGRVVSRRTGTHIELNAPEEFQRTPLYRGIRDTLARIDQVQVEAELSGSWTDPDLRIETNVTELLKSGFRDAAQAQVADARWRLESEIDRVYQEQQGELRNWLASQQVQADRLLAKADAQVQEVSRKVMTETQRGDAYLGRLRDKLPGLR